MTTELKNTQSPAAYGRNIAAGGMLGSVLGAGAQRLAGGRGRLGSLAGGVTGAAAGALHAKATDDEAKAQAFNREELHKVRKRNDERAADAHLVRHTMLRHALSDAQKSGDPEYSANLDKLRGRINRRSGEVLRGSEKVAALKTPRGRAVRQAWHDTPMPSLNSPSQIPGFDAWREQRRNQHDSTIVGPTTLAADGLEYEQATPAKWKRTMRDAAAAIGGTALGYAAGRGAVELAKNTLGDTRVGRFAPMGTAVIGGLAGVFHDDLKARMFKSRQNAERQDQERQFRQALRGKRPGPNAAKVAALMEPVAKIPKSKKTAPWKDNEDDLALFWEGMD